MCNSSTLQQGFGGDTTTIQAISTQQSLLNQRNLDKIKNDDQKILPINSL